jgi:hypothetical protein
MGYGDDHKNVIGQFTVARRVPGGDQVMGSLSLAMSLMDCVEIQQVKDEMQQQKEDMQKQKCPYPYV